MSDSQSFNALLWEVIISSRNEYVFGRDLSNFGFPITFETWWASVNVEWRCLIAWNNSRHAPSWWYNLHCRFEETGSTSIIDFILLYVLCHPSEPGTSPMGTHWLAKEHNTKLNELTESEVSELTSTTITETKLTILKRKGSQGITIESLQRKFIFVSEILSRSIQLTNTIL